MKSNIFFTQKAFALSFGFFVFLGLFSCKENNYINPDLVPNIDNINTFELTQDDLSLTMKVKMFDSFHTGNGAFYYGGIGSVANDPFFGNVQVGMNMQFTIPTINYTFPDTMSSLDSVVLILPYLNVLYGDTNSLAAYNVYQIEDPNFKIDTSTNKYYAFTNLGYNLTPIGSFEGDLKDLSRDSIFYPGIDTVGNQLRIKLSSAMVSKFAAMTSANTGNNDAFVNFLNGIYVAPKPGMSAAYNKSLNYFLFFNPLLTSIRQSARLEAFYTISGGSTTGMTTFPLNSKFSAFYTKVERNYVGYPANNYAVNGQVMDSFIITGSPGIHTDFEINNLSLIGAQNVVNIARLEINVKKTTESQLFEYPPQLSISGVYEDGGSYNIVDYQTNSSLETNNGVPLQSGLANNFVNTGFVPRVIDGEDYVTYTINLPRTIQQAIMQGKDKVIIRLYPYSQMPGAFRMIAPGFGSLSNAKAKFNIIYSKI